MKTKNKIKIAVLLFFVLIAGFYAISMCGLGGGCNLIFNYINIGGGEFVLFAVPLIILFMIILLLRKK